LDYDGFRKWMLEKGVSLDVATKTAKDVFNYTVVSDELRLLGTLQPYLNIPAVNIDALTKLLKDGDNKKLAPVI
jgi:hypothetical protein